MKGMRPDLLLYAKVAQYGSAFVAGQLELTNKCMQRCPMCKSWQDTEPMGYFGIAHAMRLWQELNNTPSFEHLSLTGGDPQCYTELQQLAELPRKFRLQISTALMKRPEPWYASFDRIRISIDALTPELYRKMRGVERSPVEVFEWMEPLEVEFATLTTINEHNAKGLDQMLALLHHARQRNPRYRKAIFLLELGRELPEWVLQEYQRAGEVANSLGMETSFGEDILETREIANSHEARGWRCAVGDISFHIKCNGDIYPCCLVGGEAITTQPEFRLGNFMIEQQLQPSRNKYRAKARCLYNEPVCRQVCQWKQLHINKMANEVRDVKISIP